MNTPPINVIDFEKSIDKLVPAIIQDADTSKVIMLGYMNEEAYLKTVQTKRVTFYSRSKKRLWIKGEKSGNYLILREIMLDCDKDTLLIKVCPLGASCHTGTYTCWKEPNEETYGFLSRLEEIIRSRKENLPTSSYVSTLFKRGLNSILQKVGEESIELIIEAKDENPRLFLNESADLLFHYMILLQIKGYTIKSVTDILKNRNVF